jgi:hypothetical protein
LLKAFFFTGDFTGLNIELVFLKARSRDSTYLNFPSFCPIFGQNGCFQHFRGKVDNFGIEVVNSTIEVVNSAIKVDNSTIKVVFLASKEDNPGSKVVFPGIKVVNPALN